MRTDTKDMSTLDRLKTETRDYLDSEHNNQVRGFHDWDGYWKTKDEAMKDTSQDRLDNLEELYTYMKSITVEDLTAWTRESGRQQLEYWTYAGVGRVSEGRKTGLRLAGATSKGSIVQNNWKILQRVIWHIGASLHHQLNGHINTALTDTEVINHIDAAASDELDSTFWKDESSRFSNAIFRLEICRTWLAGTEQERFIISKLAEVAKAWLEYKGVSIKQLVVDNYAQTIESINANIAEHEEIIKTTMEHIAGHKEAISKLRTQKRDANGEIDGMKLSLAIKLKGFIESNS